MRDIEVYDHSLNESCPHVLHLDESVPLQVCVAESLVAYENGCFYPMVIGVHYSLSMSNMVYVHDHPDSKVRAMLGLIDSYVIVVVNDDEYLPEVGYYE